MVSFTYNALDKTGQSVTGTIEAPGRSDAIAQLAERKVYVTQLQEQSSQSEAQTGVWTISFWRRRRVGRRALAAMLRQLATALQAGLPLLSALRVVEQQAVDST